MKNHPLDKFILRDLFWFLVLPHRLRQHLNIPKPPSRAYLRYRAARLIWVGGRAANINRPLLALIFLFELLRPSPSIVITVKSAP